MNNKKNGFTLLELLIVLVVIGLLMSYVGPQYFGQLKKSEIKISQAQIHQIKKALTLYRLDTGHYPAQSVGLLALTYKPDSELKWHGPYLEKQIALDPWGKAYVYRNPGKTSPIDVFSLGRDGKVGGTGDDADIFG